jgi:hypothetical protein
MRTTCISATLALGAAGIFLSSCDGAGNATASQQAGPGPVVFVIATDGSTTYELQRVPADSNVDSATDVENVSDATGWGVALDGGSGVLYVENQNTDEVVAFRDGDKSQVLFDVVVGKGTDVYQVLQVGSRLFVDRWNTNSILVLDATSGDSVRSIDLSASVNSDGLVSPSRLAFAGGKLWILAQRIHSDYTSYDSGMVIEVDTGAKAAPRGLTLPTVNPQDLAILGAKIYVASHGSYDATENGGIDRLDLATGRWEATITGKLGAHKPINNMVSVGGKLWTVLGLDIYADSSIAVSVDPVSGLFGPAVGSTRAVWGLATDGTSLWLSDKATADQQAVVKLDPATGAVLNRAKTALPPGAMAVLP